MKKILIALPLVLIMLLSMVPVFAEDSSVEVPVSYKFFKDPAKKEAVTANYNVITLKLDKAVASDAKLLKAAAMAEVAKIQKPNLNFVNAVDWDMEAIKVVPYVAASVKKTAEIVTFENIDAIEAALKAKGKTIKVDKTAAASATKLNAAGLKALQEAVEKGEATFVIKAEMVTDAENVAQQIIVNVEEKTDAKNAEVTIDIFPLCYGQEKPGKPCVHLCEQITVRAFDATNGMEIKALGATYDVNVNQYPRFDAILNDYLNVRLPMLGNGQWQVLKTWSGADSVALPNWFYVGDQKNGPCKEDLLCTILVQVLPVWQNVDVYHIFRDCCKDPDGKVSYSTWKIFYENNVRIDFITFNTQLMINQDKAAEFAKTRIEKINAKDFVFDHADFNDGINLDGYMQGTVYNLNGKVIDVVANTLPSIDLIYLRAECVQKAEEKVDNATVNNNAAAPASANANNAGQLPATGVKDVTAFFLSAVALLGLGVFFAKKH